MRIVVLGGGSAGWMSAAYLKKTLPTSEVTLVESPSIETVGVGESTLVQLKIFCKYLEIDEKQFMKETDASYKLSIKFTDFYDVDSGSFYYPFGIPDLSGTNMGLQDWLIKKFVSPETPLTDFAECYFPSAIMSRLNKFPSDSSISGFNHTTSIAYHFDAAKFGMWLRDKYCLPIGVSRVIGTVVEVKTDENGVSGLVIDNGSTITADLYVDCTGWKSMLLGDSLQEPFTSYSDMLPNNRAWAVQIPYVDKEREIEPFTNCTAIGHGWCWNIPLWSRLGTGYVYSDRFISPEEAKEEYRQYLMSDKMVVPRTKEQVDALSFKDIQMRIGIHERTWVKNVVAIGLSAGFIEPLESNGLYTVHEFLFQLGKVLKRHTPTQWDIDLYNLATYKLFNEFAEFVALHYALSARRDTEYWQKISKTSFMSLSKTTPSMFAATIDARTRTFMSPERGGATWIMSGMNHLTLESTEAEKGQIEMNNTWSNVFAKELMFLDSRRRYWENAISQMPSLFEHLSEMNCEE